MSEHMRRADRIVKRNHVRDYRNVAALSAVAGVEHSARVLAGADEFYTDPRKGEGSFSGQLVHTLGNPRPKDTTQLARLSQYKGLVRRWQDWNAMMAQMQMVAAHMLDEHSSDGTEHHDV